MLAPEITIPNLKLGDSFDLINTNPLPRFLTNIVSDFVPIQSEAIGWETYDSMSNVVESLDISAALTANYLFASGSMGFDISSSRLNNRNSFGFYFTFKKDHRAENINSYTVPAVLPALLPPYITSSVKWGTRLQARFALVFDSTESFRSYNANSHGEGTLEGIGGKIDEHAGYRLKSINQSCSIDVQIYKKGTTSTTLNNLFINKNDPAAIDQLIVTLATMVNELLISDNAVPVDYKFTPTANYIVDVPGTAANTTDVNISALNTSLKGYLKSTTAQAKLESILDGINNGDPMFEYLRNASADYYQARIDTVNPLVTAWSDALRSAMMGNNIPQIASLPKITWPRIKAIVNPATWAQGGNAWDLRVRVFGGEDLFFQIEQYGFPANNLSAQFAPADITFHPGTIYDFYYDVHHLVGARNGSYLVLAVYDQVGKPVLRIRINELPPAKDVL